MIQVRVAMRIFTIVLLGICMVSNSVGLAASNWVSESGMTDTIVHSPITANDLKPLECDSLDLQNLITGSGIFSGTSGNDLILASAGRDEVNGVDGADCIIGGSGNDYLLNGSGGNSQSVLDKFDITSYSNNNGTQNWATDWQEINEYDGPAFGDVNIEVSLGRGFYNQVTDQDTYIDERNPNNNYGLASFLKVRGQAGDMNRSLLRFDVSSIPAGSNVLSATVYFYATHKIDSPVYVHRITGDWTETGATWNNSATAYDSFPIGTLNPVANFQIYSVNITTLVQEWVNGSIPNQGVMLVATNGAVESRFASREASETSQKPYLAVELSQGGGVMANYSSRDTYLQERNPNTNYGSSTDLQVNPNVGSQKRAMLGFDMSTIPATSVVQSAIAYFYNTQPNNNPVYLHPITNGWTESGATWNNSANGFDPTPVGSFTPYSRNQFHFVDITPLVQGWVNGTITNHGLMLIATPGASETRYSSKEQTGIAQDPHLLIILAPGGPSQSLRIQNASKGAWRQVVLSLALSAQLQFDFLRQNLDDANDYISLAVSNDGGVSWFDLAVFAGPATDNQFQTISIDISGFLSANTQIRFLSSDSMTVDDRVYFDNIQITYFTEAPAGGASILLGGAGDDTLDGNGYATCYGGDGNDTFLDCQIVFDP